MENEDFMWSYQRSVPEVSVIDEPPVRNPPPSFNVPTFSSPAFYSPSIREVPPTPTLNSTLENEVLYGKIDRLMAEMRMQMQQNRDDRKWKELDLTVGDLKLEFTRSADSMKMELTHGLEKLRKDMANEVQHLFNDWRLEITTELRKQTAEFRANLAEEQKVEKIFSSIATQTDGELYCLSSKRLEAEHQMHRLNDTPLVNGIDKKLDFQKNSTESPSTRLQLMRQREETASPLVNGAPHRPPVTDRHLANRIQEEIEYYPESAARQAGYEPGLERVKDRRESPGVQNIPDTRRFIPSRVENASPEIVVGSETPKQRHRQLISEPRYDAMAKYPGRTEESIMGDRAIAKYLHILPDAPPSPPPRPPPMPRKPPQQDLFVLGNVSFAYRCGDQETPTKRLPVRNPNEDLRRRQGEDNYRPANGFAPRSSRSPEEYVNHRGIREEDYYPEERGNRRVRHVRHEDDYLDGHRRGNRVAQSPDDFDNRYHPRVNRNEDRYIDNVRRGFGPADRGIRPPPIYDDRSSGEDSDPDARAPCQPHERLIPDLSEIMNRPIRPHKYRTREENK